MFRQIDKSQLCANGFTRELRAYLNELPTAENISGVVGTPTNLYFLASK